ncbi:MAG: hypothetical protein U9R25_00670 [Chloroflexota bacterium]|nr:hypothetical protein [Chloroflexota bacterium]
MDEKELAGQLSDFLDDSPDWPLPVGLDAGTVETAARLAALPTLLPDADPVFGQRVWARLQAIETQAESSQRKLAWSWPGGFNLRWLAPVAALLLVIVLVLPGPRQALGNWMARFSLGSVDVAVAPEETVRPALAATEMAFDTLAAAEERSGFELRAPSFLPHGYRLTGVDMVTYGALPLSLQPLYVESRYEPDYPAGDVGFYAVLRQFNGRLPSGDSPSRIEFQSQDVHSVNEIVIGEGLPAVMLEVGPPSQVLRQLVWQHDGVTLELWSQVLTQEEMLRIAESLQ